MDAQNYATHYAATHEKPVTPEYVADYSEFVILDTMLTDYRLLLVGAGTGGFIRLMRNYREIVCIDRMPEMVDAAVPAPRVTYQCADFANYDGAAFDAVSISGVIGWYVPWTGNEWALEKCHALLKPGGLLVASHVPPANLFHRAKELAFPRRTVVINRRRFLRMMERDGFAELARVHYRASAISIFKTG